MGQQYSSAVPVPLSDSINTSLAENGRYCPVEVLGQGTFGKVIRALDQHTNEQVAIKLLGRGERNKYVESEVINHSLLRHPHIIQFREVFLTSQHVCIVMEYAAAGTLLRYVQRQKKPSDRHSRLKEALGRWFFQQLVIAVDYCHKRGVVSRDLKLENALLQNVSNVPLPILKICDFGYSKADHMSDPKSTVGTLAYMAPEVLLSRSHGYEGTKADVWSCGVMLYIMLCGKFPFANTNPSALRPDSLRETFERMISKSYVIPEGVELSESCRDLLGRLLEPEPLKRITLEGVQQHSWFLANLPPEAMSMNSEALMASSDLELDAVMHNIRTLLAEPVPRPLHQDIVDDQDEECFMEKMDLALAEDLEHYSSTTLKQYVQQHRS